MLKDHFRQKRTQAEPVETKPQLSPGLRTSLQKQMESGVYAKECPQSPLSNYVSSGSEHEVRKVIIEKVPHVVKTLKPTAREILVFGKGMDPEEAVLVRDRVKPVPQSIAEKEVDTEAVVTYMQEVQALAETYLGEVIMPTKIYAQDGRVHRIQRFLPYLPPQDPFEISLQTVKKVDLYGALGQQWQKMLFSSDFHQMPTPVQVFCRAFPPDNGLGSNAFFRGLGCSPEFIVIDF